MEFDNIYTRWLEMICEREWICGQDQQPYVNGLDNLERWSHKWDMEFNPSTTKNARRMWTFSR